MIDAKTFLPVIDRMVILPDPFRRTLADWLDENPSTPEGHLLVGVAEQIEIRPAESYSSKAREMVLGSEACMFRRIDTCPFYLDDAGRVQGVDIDLLRADWMRPYRDVFFELAHSRYEASLQEAEIKVITSARGRTATVIHLRHATILIDDDPMPKAIRDELLSDSPNPDARDGLVTVFPYADLGSAHGRMSFMAGLPRLNREIAAVWISNASRKPGDPLPRPITAEDLALA